MERTPPAASCQFLSAYGRALRRVRAQTDYDGPWHLLATAGRGAPVLFETAPTTRQAIMRAYRLCSESGHDVVFTLAMPGQPRAFAEFRGALPLRRG